MSVTLLDGLANGIERLVWWIPPGEWRTELKRDIAGLLSGSFNPLHQGHLRLCEAAARHLGGLVACELSMANTQKPAIAVGEVERRCRQFTRLFVAVTAAATFAEKSQLFPGVTFVVGGDTAARIVDSTYYRNDVERMDAALTSIRDQGCSFLVAARWCGQELIRLESLPIPDRHQRLFREIPAEKFLLDLSSTQIRNDS